MFLIKNLDRSTESYATTLAAAKLKARQVDGPVVVLDLRRKVGYGFKVVYSRGL